MSYIVEEFDQRDSVGDGAGDEPTCRLIVRDEEEAQLLILVMFLEHWRTWQSRDEWDDLVNEAAERVIRFLKAKEEERSEDAWEEVTTALNEIATNCLFPFTYGYQCIDGAPAGDVRKRLKGVLKLIREDEKERKSA